MKKMFTKLFSTGLLMCLMLIGFAVKAQTTSLADNTQAASPNVSSTPTNVDTKADAKTAEKAKAKAKAEAIADEKMTKKADEDTTWKPQRRLWGYTFGDFYYDAHADAGNRGPETQYNGVPTYRNAFQFRRLYLGYDYEITKKFKAEVLLATEPNANTGVVGATSTSTTTLTGVAGGTATTKTTTTTTVANGDNLVDGKMAFWIKNFNIRVRDLWTGTDFVIGELSTPSFALNEPGTNGPTSLSETTWAYRSIEKTITDFHKNNSYDVGAALQGTFDPSTKNFGYVAMIGNNTTSSLLPAANANSGFYKIFYGDIWAKFFNQKLFVDIYSDYAKTGPATATIPDPGQEHSMWKIFASYNSKPITIGVEAYTQKIANALNNTTTGAAEDATVTGISFWVRGNIAKNLNYFARYDTYNPDTKFNTGDTYTTTYNTNYGNYTPLTKEQFYTAGLDYNPTKNVHFMPNFWLVDYSNQGPTAATVANDHTLVFRFTFFYTFGK